MGEIRFGAVLRLFWLQLRPALLILAVLCSVCPEASAAEQPVSEAQVKAAFVLNFIKFVTWPESEGESGEFSICTMKHSVLTEVIAQLAKGGPVAGKRVSVRKVDRLNSKQCRVVLVESEDYPEFASTSKALANQPVLTIGSGAGFTEGGGMLELFTENRRIQFDAYLPAIQRSGLSVSASLLRLARNLRKPAR